MSDEKYNEIELTRIFKDITLSLEANFKKIEALERSKELVLSYRELSKRECDGRIQEVKKELKELEKKFGDINEWKQKETMLLKFFKEEIEKLKNTRYFLSW